LRETEVGFLNSYEDAHRANAYAQLKFSGTYYLAYRDLPDIISKYVNGRKSLDFGCGTGRSTRFLKKLGFNATGVDISKTMIHQAKKIDPAGDYQIIKDEKFDQFGDETFDLVFSIFTFDNIPTNIEKERNLQEIFRVLRDEGVFINLVSSPEIYVNEWISFSTKDFPENKQANSGDIVKIIITDIGDKRPVEDIFFSPEDYRKLFINTGFKIENIYKPLAEESNQNKWINETKIPPWNIYILKKFQN
jgi:ubiquinone/menaquinone biosynthesis C-methylase UbiE